MNLEKISAQEMFQKLKALSQYQIRLRKSPPPSEEYKQAYSKLLGTLKAQMILWGGINVIDKWLRDNDSGHDELSDIEGLNLKDLE